ncbi:MAG: hypothetical protein IJ661_08285 [Lachnospiraceae bacterium]|nr:hypothetical protein [Lachnospiraceae bacterium]
MTTIFSDLAEVKNDLEWKEDWSSRYASNVEELIKQIDQYISKQDMNNVIYAAYNQYLRKEKVDCKVIAEKTGVKYNTVRYQVLAFSDRVTKAILKEPLINVVYSLDMTRLNSALEYALHVNHPIMISHDIKLPDNRYGRDKLSNKDIHNLLFLIAIQDDTLHKEIMDCIKGNDIQDAITELLSNEVNDTNKFYRILRRQLIDNIMNSKDKIIKNINNILG